jgi:hypothetical protein
MERLGVTVLQMPTVLYGRRPDRGKPGGGPMPATLLGAMLEGLRDDGRLATVDAVHCGYLALPEQIAVVMEAADRVRSVNKAAVFVVDPVIGDAERGLYVPQQVAEGVAETLVREADWITPNAWELARIVGRDSLDLQGLRQAARRLGKPIRGSERSMRRPPGTGWSRRRGCRWRPKARAICSPRSFWRGGCWGQRPPWRSKRRREAFMMCWCSNSRWRRRTFRCPPRRSFSRTH